MEEKAINPKLTEVLQNLSLKEQQILAQQLKTPDTQIVHKYNHNFSNKKKTIGIISDTHIGSKYFNRELFDKLLKFFEKKKVEGIYHAGDILEGMSHRPGHIYELDMLGFTSQIEGSTELLKQTMLPIYGITGNHDAWFLKNGNIGADVGKHLEDKLENFTFLGQDEADIELFPGIVMKLIHPGKGTAYALSYQGQKLIESFDDENKPQIVVSGHYHKAMYMNIRNVHHFEAGTLQNQSGWMRSKNIPAHVGGWLLNIYKDGRINMEFIK